MLETSRFWLGRFAASLGVLAAGCVAVETPPPEPPKPAPAVVVAPKPDENALMEEARAMLAQAETDVQRARAKRALWQKAWEDLLASRQAVAAKDHVRAKEHAKRASELAQLGLEQLAYPAVN
jgi:hypothetical protein